jgi:hypothetical protein
MVVSRTFRHCDHLAFSPSGRRDSGFLNAFAMCVSVLFGVRASRGLRYGDHHA